MIVLVLAFQLGAGPISHPDDAVNIGRLSGAVGSAPTDKAVLWLDRIFIALRAVVAQIGSIVFCVD